MSLKKLITTTKIIYCAAAFGLLDYAHVAPQHKSNFLVFTLTETIKMTQAFDFEKAMAPSKAFAALAIEKSESLIALNTALLNKYSAMTIANAKAAMEVKDAEAAKAYFAEQNAKAKEIMEGLVEDSKAVAKISQDYTAEVQKLVTTSSKEAVEAVKTAVTPKA
ncbi:phasin family protein [Leucothrix mucor]|uniref:phasin family protein n=1 Tax=Leucothrix mucor TaxID=45248 RepID=UPI00146A67A1|nr:phasin family protein [Leucothrix mucor]